MDDRSLLLILLVPAAGIALWLVCLLPLWVLFLVAVGLFFIGPGLIPPVYEVSELTVRAVDLVVLLILARLLLLVGLGRYPAVVPRVVLPIAVLLLYIGASVLRLSAETSLEAARSFASYARLLETALFLPLSYLVLRPPRRVGNLIRFYAVAGVASVAIMVVRMLIGAVPEMPPAEMRGVGALSTNSVGLVSGILLFLVVVLGDQIRGRWLVGAIGILGLALTKSLAATISTLIVIGIYEASKEKSRLAAIPVRYLGLLGVALVVSIGAAWWLRPVDVQGFLTFSGGSFVERVYLMTSGLNMFLENPLFGGGWQTSMLPASLDHAAQPPGIFGEELVAYYQSVLANQSVHNMYVQLLAEQGVIGFALFLIVLASISRYARRVLARLAGRPDLQRQARFLSLTLLLMSIWWNSSALFPGQVESVLAMVFIGALVALGRLPPESSGRNQPRMGRESG